MAISIKNAVRVFERAETAEVSCGGAWVCTIKSLRSTAPLIQQKRASMYSKGQTKKGAVTSVEGLSALSSGVDTGEYLFGSQEADVEFFVTNVLVNWRGLTDDSGESVPYSVENAMEVILQNGKAGLQFYRELMVCCMDDALFIPPAADSEIDSKN